VFDGQIPHGGGGRASGGIGTGWVISVVFFLLLLAISREDSTLTYVLLSIYSLYICTLSYTGRVVHTRCVWAGGTFFLVVPLCQFSVCDGKWFLVLLPCLEDNA
jgi:hypothetical protein